MRVPESIADDDCFARGYQSYNYPSRLDGTQPKTRVKRSVPDVEDHGAENNWIASEIGGFSLQRIENRDKTTDKQMKHRNAWMVMNDIDINPIVSNVKDTSFSDITRNRDIIVNDPVNSTSYKRHEISVKLYKRDVDSTRQSDPQTENEGTTVPLLSDSDDNVDPSLMKTGKALAETTTTSFPFMFTTQSPTRFSTASGSLRTVTDGNVTEEVTPEEVKQDIMILMYIRKWKTIIL